jgi:REP element-mobilizing transposase RayT
MRNKRLVLPGTAYYHCASGVRGQQTLLSDDEKRRLWDVIRRVSEFSGVEVKTHCLMDNHFHLVIKIPKRRDVDDRELETRMRSLYGDIGAEKRLEQWKTLSEQGENGKVAAEKAALRKRIYNLSDFFKTFKERFAKSFNRRAGTRGVFWSERFQSLVLDPKYKLLTDVGAHVDRNPVRTRAVENAEDYRFSGFGSAARGDKSALEGIRDLVCQRGAKDIGLEEAFEEYGKLVKKVRPGGNDGGVAAESGDETRHDFIKGVAIGTLKFVEVVVCGALNFIFDHRKYRLGGRYNTHDEYYRAFGTNNRRK